MMTATSFNPELHVMMAHPMTGIVYMVPEEHAMALQERWHQQTGEGDTFRKWLDDKFGKSSASEEPTATATEDADAISSDDFVGVPTMTGEEPADQEVEDDFGDFEEALDDSNEIDESFDS